MSQEDGGPSLPRLPLRSLLVGLVTVQSAFGLSEDIPKLFGDNADYFATVVDAGFLVAGTSQLLSSAGVIRRQEDPDGVAGPTMDGFQCKITLNIGREPGTWMPTEWAASGARLSLPVMVEFSDEQVDLGFEGEESFGGARYAKRLKCEAGSFVGPQGVVVVSTNGGAWTTLPSGRPGERVIRFFLDFPDGAARNDVTLPAGRVFFSTVCWDSTKQPETAAELPDAMVMPGPDGVQVLTSGGLTIKRNDARNLWGALGDVNLILGRFSASPASDVA